MSSLDREALARKVAPFGPSIWFLTVPAIQHGSWPYHIDIVYIVVVSFSVSFAAFHLMGLPLINLLRKHKLLNIFSLIIGGALLGTVALIFFMILFAAAMGSLQYTKQSNLLGYAWDALCMGGTFGFSVAAIYGAIAGWPKYSFNQESLS
jgi:hypothetical protein